MARKKQSREYIFRGTVELIGVTFFVDACDEKEACEKAKAGDYSDYDPNGAETINWEINPHTCEPNE